MQRGSKDKEVSKWESRTLALSPCYLTDTVQALTTTTSKQEQEIRLCNIIPAGAPVPTLGFCLCSKPQLKGCWVGGARLAATQAGWLAAEEPPHFD